MNEQEQQELINHFDHITRLAFKQTESLQIAMKALKAISELDDITAARAFAKFTMLEIMTKDIDIEDKS